MAYTKQTWNNGDIITADKLNHIEDGIKNNESGYSISEEETILFEGEITPTESSPYYTYLFNPPIIFNQENLIIICDGQEYQCEKKELNMGAITYYGDYDSDTGGIIFTNYPFFLGEDYQEPSFDIFFPTGESHSIIIKTLIKTVTTKEDFNKAVNNCININTINNIKDSQNYGIIEGLIPGLKIDNTTILTAENANQATGKFAHAEGGYFGQYDGEYYFYPNTASGITSHAEGWQTTASGQAAHTEGDYTTASGNYSHAEGGNTTASGNTSHAEGNNTTASGIASHVEGSGSTASGEYSHAEGIWTTASGNYSHTEGEGTIANHNSQHVIGQYNIADPSSANSNQRGNYVCIIGNGTTDKARSNALAIKWDGTFVFANGTQITPAEFASLKALLNQS